jgi:pyrimidine-nucleoside phosphorylase
LIAYDLIDQKKRGRAHSPAQIAALVRAITDGSIPDYQLSAWLMAVWHRGLDAEETHALTVAMRDSGDRLDLSRLPGPTADKHSTGGVGDKISLLLAPLAAAVGLYVPMLSGRGLGHTGGTLDKLTAIDGYRVDLSPDEMLEVVERVGCSIIGQTARIAPADRRLYALRDVTATVDCIPLIVSSIMSKKLAAGPQHLVIDLKCGSGAFMRDRDQARALALALLDVGRREGRSMSALLTDMGQPLGETVGHALEVEEALTGLRGEGPASTRELTVALVSEMLRLAQGGTHDDAHAVVVRALDEGRALERFVAMVEAHGGRVDPERPRLDIAEERAPLLAEREGFVFEFATEEFGWAVMDLGGGRRRHDDTIDLGVGLRVQVRRGDRVRAGDALVRIHARDDERARAARERLRRAVRIADAAPDPVDLILEVVR